VISIFADQRLNFDLLTDCYAKRAKSQTELLHAEEAVLRMRDCPLREETLERIGRAIFWLDEIEDRLMPWIEEMMSEAEGNV
jgi:hypothetical protein